MNLYGYEFERESDLTHHGIKGQKWGIRRFQNEDGSLTPAGRRRFEKFDRKFASKRYGISDADYDAGMAAANKAIAERKTRRIENKQHRADMKRAPYLKENERSKNVFLDKMGGRKINADYTTRKNRGEALVARNRSRIGAVGRHIGRGIVAGAGLTGISLLTNMSLSGTGAAAANAVLRGVGTAVTVSSLIRTYQDISDINTYRDAKVRGK